jgi:pyruvate dehydrogenase E2 component (dihydrolipoyllysine-residue acetyltransferase)
MSATLLPVSVPDIGDFSDVPVIEILVGVGDTVAAEDPLVTLESDKATMDVPAPAAGKVSEINVKLGDPVSEGTLLMSIEQSSGPAVQAREPEHEGPATPTREARAEISAPAPPPAPSAVPETRFPPESARSDGSPSAGGSAQVYASPSVRRLARELGVSLAEVRGSGRKGRITAEDVRRLEPLRATGGRSVDGAGAGLSLAPWPVVDFERYGPVERVKRSRIQRASAPNLARNWVMIPHVTHNDEADITELEEWRRRLNDEYARATVKFTMVSFLIAASVATLKEFPDFNASLDGDELVLRRYYNIGFAADTPEGLVVPVIREADGKGLAEIAQELTDLSRKAREGKLSPAEMSGGTFTISSLGGIGGTSFTPIINAPEVAILGVTRASMRPVWDGSEFVPRLMLPLSLSYDHRVIDGATAARFVVHLAKVLGDLRRALL